MENIITKLREINEKYQETNNVTKKIFDSLKKKEYKQLADLNEEQMLLMSQIDSLTTESKEMIEKECLIRGIKEIKLSLIFGEMNQKEKEQVMKVQKQIKIEENELTNNLNINREMLKIILDTKKTVLDVVSHSAEHSTGEQSSVFLNTKF